MVLSKVGYHTTIKDILLEDTGFDTYQVFLGSPRRYNKPEPMGLEKIIDKNIVVHSPYWVQLAKDITDKSFMRTLEYTIQVTKVLHSVGVRYYVTHIGSRTEDMTIARSYGCMREFCIKWLMATEGCDTILCLENDSGSKKGTRMGSVKLLTRLIEDINHPRVRMTFDTEHAYANGLDLSRLDYIKSFEDKIAVVHFNSIPVEVERGSHLDRHSSTSIVQCKEGVEYILNVFRTLYNGVRPFIFEVGDFDIVSHNMKMIEERCRDVWSKGII